jgi:hypothetical protein
MVARKSRPNNRIRVPALSRVRHLQRDHGGYFRVGHAAAGAHAGQLHFAGSGDHDDVIHATVSAGFEKQRDIQHHERCEAASGPRQETALRLAHHRVQDAFELAHRGRVREHLCAQRGAVERAVHDHAREGLFDCRQRAAVRSLQRVDGGVGVEHRHAGAAEGGGGGGFAHADAAGQADDFHVAGISEATRSNIS